MNQKTTTRWIATVLAAGVGTALILASGASDSKPQKFADGPVADAPVAAEPLPAFVERGIDWLVEAQQADGGWGAGSHSRQEVRDPLAVPTDPASTALTAMALLRSGHTPKQGRHQAAVLRATDYLLATVERSPDSGPKITNLTGTQPQSKMGPYVDTALTAQYLSRLLPAIEDDRKLEARVTAALDKCLRKIETSQGGNGSWADGGWAPVLQSSLMSSALEMAQDAGREVDEDALKRARDYQKDQVDSQTGAVAADSAAGVPLYSSSSNWRAVAAEAKAAGDVVGKAKLDGILAQNEPVTEESLRKAGVAPERAKELSESWKQNILAKSRAFDENLLDGFGSNGGEEFLSYMLVSESLVIDGGEQLAEWNAKMRQRLAKIQNGNGSWSGHHCITSPVFCTAAVILSLTAERDAVLLAQAAEHAVPGPTS